MTRAASCVYNDDGDEVINQYVMLQTLGKGAFGEVKLALNNRDKEYYVALAHQAIKIQDKGFLASKFGPSHKNQAEAMLMKEIAIMKKMKHPNILQLFEVIEDSTNELLYIVTEFMRSGCIGGNEYLQSIGASIGKIPEERIWKHFRECISGLFYCRRWSPSTPSGQSGPP